MVKLNVVENTMRSSTWGFVGKIVSMVGAFVVRTFIIKELGTEYMGLNSLFVSILSILNLSELGFSSAVVFAMYRPISIGDEETVCKLLFLLKKVYRYVALFVFLAGAAIIPILPHIILSGIPADVDLYVLYLIFLTNTALSYLFAAYRTAIFSAYQRNDITAKITIVTDIICYGIQIIVLSLTKNYYFYILVSIVVYIPGNLLIYRFSNKYFSSIRPTENPPKSEIKKIKDSIIPLVGHKIGATFLVSTDSIVISAFLGLRMLGLYNNYYFIMMAVISFTSIIQQALIAGIGNKLSYLDSERKRELYDNLSFAWYCLVGICCCCLISLFQPFITIWLGSRYQLPDNTVIIISLYYYCWQFRVIGLTFKDAAGLWKNDWLKPYLGMILNISFSIILVILLKSVIAVLIPTAIIMLFIYFPWETNVISKEVLSCDIKTPIINAAKHILLTLSCAAVCYYVNNQLIQNNSFTWLPIRLLIAVSLPCIVYTIVYKKSKVFIYCTNVAKMVLKR